MSTVQHRLAIDFGRSALWLVIVDVRSGMAQGCANKARAGYKHWHGVVIGGLALILSLPFLLLVLLLDGDGGDVQLYQVFGLGRAESGVTCRNA